MALVTYNYLGSRARRLFWDLVWDPDLVALWCMNETGGGTVYDRCTKNIINGTVNAAPTYSVALSNGFYGLTFSASSSQYVSLGTPASMAFNRADAFSAIALLTVNDTAAIKVVVGRRSNAATPQGWTMQLSATEVLTVVLVDSGGGTIQVDSNAALSTGTLIMPGFSYSGSGAATGITLYNNGASVADTDTTNTMTTDPSYTGVNASIAGRNDADLFFDGTIGMLAVFNAAKTAADFRRWAFIAGQL